MQNRIGRFFYRYVCQRTSTFVLGIIGTSILFEPLYDYLCESIFESINKGRLWMHIKHKYENPLDITPYFDDENDNEAEENEVVEVQAEKGYKVQIEVETQLEADNEADKRQ